MNTAAEFNVNKFILRGLFTAVLTFFCGNVTYAQVQPGQGYSSVSLYGLIGVYVDKSRVSSQPSVPLQLGGGGMTTSYWGLGGQEDLGGGTKAIFAFESFFRPTTGEAGRNATDPAGLSRNAYIGFANDAYGTFKFGRQTAQTYITQIMLNPFGSSVVFSPLIVDSYTSSYNPTVIGDTVWNQTVGYYSPSVHGFSGVVQYAVSDGNSQSHDNLGLHLTYKSGPLQVAMSAQRVRGALAVPGAVQYLYLAGATYDMKFLKLYGALQTTHTITSQFGSHTYEIGMRVPVTAMSAVLAEWAMTRENMTNSQHTTRNTVSIAYDYSLSKRTDVYLVYMADKLTNNGLGNTFGVGVQHTF